jgi:hypothetical protein
LKGAIRSADPALAARMDAADLAYKEGLGKINSTFGKDIHKYAKAGQYDKIAKTIAGRSVSVDDIPRIMEVAGPEGTEAMQASVIANLVSLAKTPGAQGGQLTPQALGRAMKTFGEDRLAALLTPQQMANLTDVATLSSSLQKGTKVMEGSQTAYLLSNMNVAAMGYHILGAPFRRFLGSPAGQRWITSGYQPFTREGATRAATRAGHAATIPLTADDPE